jgi:hypothetical protein
MLGAGPTGSFSACAGQHPAVLFMVLAFEITVPSTGAQVLRQVLGDWDAVQYISPESEPEHIGKCVLIPAQLKIGQSLAQQHSEAVQGVH